MKVKNAMIIFLVGAALFGLISNSLTLVYIFQTFNIKTHVFTLLFIDALFSALCCALSSIVDFLVMFDFMEVKYIYCNLSYVAVYYSACFGAFVTLLIASIRYYLSIHSLQNIQPEKVSKLAFSVLSAFEYRLCCCQCWIGHSLCSAGGRMYLHDKRIKVFKIVRFFAF